MAVKYRLIYASKRELLESRNPVVLLKSVTAGSTYSFTPDEHDLVALFDGERTLEDVLDAFYRRKNIRLGMDKLVEFSSKLLEEGLLEVAHDDRGAAAPREDKKAMWNDMVRDLGGMGRVADPSMRDSILHGKSPDGEGGGSDSLGQQPKPSIDALNERLVEHLDEFQEELERGRPKVRIPLPIGFLSPLGFLITLPVRSTVFFWLLLVAVAGTAYGVISDWELFTLDLRRMISDSNVIQAMLISVLSVNLGVQLASWSMFKREMGHPPRFGIAFFFGILPRFHADVVDLRFVQDRKKRMALRGSVLTTLMVLMVVAASGWMATRQSATMLPLICVWITAVSTFVFVLQLNPLGKGAGYDVLAAALRIPDLRRRALMSLYRVHEPPTAWGTDSKKPFPAALRLYGLCTVIFLCFTAYVVFAIIGVWMEQRWGGLGVLMFVGLVFVGLVRPLIDAYGRAKRLKQSKEMTVYQSRYRKKPPMVRSSLTYLLAAAILIFLGSLPYVYESGGTFVILPSERVDVRALISGEVRSIEVKEGEPVSEGQLLGTLSGDEQRSSLAVSEAKLLELNAMLRMLETGATQEDLDLAKQRVRTAQTKYRYSKERADRYVELYRTNAVSLNNYELVISDAAVDLERLREAQLSLAAMEAGTRPEQIEVVKADIEQELAVHTYNKTQLAYTRLKAPIDGRIVSGSLKFAVGDFLNRGELLAVVERTGSVTAEIFVPEVDIGEVRIGERVRMKPWSYPDREFYGVVRQIAPAAEIKEFGKVVRVLTEIPNDEGMLKSEMTGHAKIRGETRPAAIAFTRMLYRFVVVEIWSWGAGGQPGAATGDPSDDQPPRRQGGWSCCPCPRIAPCR